MKKNFIVSCGLMLAMFVLASCCAKEAKVAESMHYTEWHVNQLTPEGTRLAVIGELYKPIHVSQNKQIGVLVTQVNGTPTVEYPIMRRTVDGDWVVASSGFDRKDMIRQYNVMAWNPILK